MSMDKEASEQLGEPVTAGVQLLHSGMAKDARKVGLRSAGLGLVGVAAAALVDKQKNSSSLEANVVAPEYGGFVAVTPTRVVLFALEKGFLRHKLGKSVETFHRGDLAGIELGKAALGVAIVDLVLADRRRYRFEMSSMFTKRLQPVADALGVTVSGG